MWIVIQGRSCSQALDNQLGADPDLCERRQSQDCGGGLANKQPGEQRALLVREERNFRTCERSSFWKVQKGSQLSAKRFW